LGDLGPLDRSVEDYLADGWMWLDAHCCHCGNRHQAHLRDIVKAQPGAPVERYTRRLVCAACRTRDLTITLGKWRMSGGQPWPVRQTIGD
jgi:hypothetical protein